jgi:hypothetical protein
VYPVYQAKDLIEAELLLQRLRDRNIPSAIQNGFLEQSTSKTFRPPALAPQLT